MKIYVYDSWNDSFLPEFKQKTIELDENEIKIETSNTSPPTYLSESELINLMHKNGIGTDATIHDHIKNICLRGYVLRTGTILKPTLLGTALIKVYEYIGIELYKPYLRAQMERDMTEVAEGKKDKVRLV